MVRQMSANVMRSKGRSASPLRSYRQREALMAIAFALPAFVTLILFRIWPAFNAFRLSTESYSFFVNAPTRFVGLDNYWTLFQSEDFHNSVKVTLIFSLIIVPLQLIASLGLALLLTQGIPGVRIWRFVMFLPFSVPLGISTLIWGVAFRPDGPLNAVLTSIGISSQPFLTSVSQAMPSIMVLVSWVGIGYWMVYLIAGLQDVPVSILEAAAVDGATWWRRFRDIILPLMKRPLAFVVIANTIANLLIFAPVQALTRGGPQGSTDFIMYDVYENAYVIGNQPLANAEVVVLTSFILIVVIFQFRLMRTEERR